MNLLEIYEADTDYLALEATHTIAWCRVVLLFILGHVGANVINVGAES